MWSCGLWVFVVVDSVESASRLGLSGINAALALQTRRREAQSQRATAARQVASTAGMGHVNGVKTIDLQEHLTAMGTCSLVRGEEMLSGESGGSDKDQGICSLGLPVGHRHRMAMAKTPPHSRQCLAEAESGLSAGGKCANPKRTKEEQF